MIVKIKFNFKGKIKVRVMVSDKISHLCEEGSWRDVLFFMFFLVFWFYFKLS